jgi:hypothetical protein
MQVAESTMQLQIVKIIRTGALITRVQSKCKLHVCVWHVLVKQCDVIQLSEIWRSNRATTSKTMTAWWLASARPDSDTTVGMGMFRSRHTSRREHTTSFA